jgi:hypothetical protein
MFGGQLQSVKHSPFEQAVLIGTFLAIHSLQKEHFVSFRLQQRQIVIWFFFKIVDAFLLIYF